MSHKICITQLTSPVTTPRVVVFLFPALPFASTLLTLSIFSSGVHRLPEHFFFPSHYNATLILNMEPTVTD